MEKSVFEIPKMDCPAEENLIRLRLEGIRAVRHLDFEISQRRLTVFHDERITEIENSINDLKLGARLLTTEKTGVDSFEKPETQRKLLWTVLAINFGFFVFEMITGLVSGSIGLVADSLDMLADSSVYAISIFAVGAAISRKKRVATFAGYFQIVLAVIGLIEVVRRFAGVAETPDFSTMIVVSILALAANGFCLYLLQKSGSKDAHMQASTIFTSNDVIINLGVIAAGILVFWSGSSTPDLIVGTIVFVVVIRGATRILRLGKQ